MDRLFDVMLAEGAAAPSAGGSMMGTLLFMIPIFAIMYFLMIRPQQKKQKEHEEMISHIKAGDKVMTNGGIFGTVYKVTDNRVTITIADKVNVEFINGAIANVIKDDDGTKEGDKKEAEKK